MKFTAKRLLAAGAIGISAIVTPLSLAAALSGVASAPSSVAGATAFDTIQFNQATGPADSFVYQPSGGQAVTQTANVSGTCATATNAAGPVAPILSMCGYVYPSIDYTGTPKSAGLGTNGPATGVGAVSPAWTIDNKTSGNKNQAEAIDFSPGSDTTDIGSNRVFTDAQIPVQRKDTGVATHPFLTVELAEYSSTTPSAATLLGKEDCTLTGNTGSQITVDPDNAALCPVIFSVNADGSVPSTFQTIEVRDTTNSTSISVVGPTATFELATTVCSGHTVTSTNEGGGAVASVTLPPVAPGSPLVCKSYTQFTSTVVSGKSTVTFNGMSGSPVQFYVHVVWPAVALCSPYVDPQSPPGTPAPGGTTGITDAPGVIGGTVADMCPVHSFTFNGTDYFDQGYCQAAQAPVAEGGTAVEQQQEMCTVTKAYNNDVLNADGTVHTNPDGTPTAIPGPGGQPGTQIVENWAGYIDWGYH